MHSHVSYIVGTAVNSAVECSIVRMNTQKAHSLRIAGVAIVLVCLRFRRAAISV